MRHLLRRPAGMAPPPSLYLLSPRYLLAHCTTIFRDPRYFWNRLLVMLYQLFHPGAPWLTAECIRILERTLSGTMVGFEWGSGRSTLWFAQRLKSLVSIEHDPLWHATVCRGIQRRRITNVDLRLTTTEDDGNRYVHEIDRFVDGSLDFILIDGDYRDRCLAAAVPKLRANGWLVVDNEEYGYDFTPCVGLERIRTTNGVWSTIIFRRPPAVGSALDHT